MFLGRKLYTSFLQMLMLFNVYMCKCIYYQLFTALGHYSSLSFTELQVIPVKAKKQLLVVKVNLPPIRKLSYPMPKLLVRILVQL